MRGFQALRDVDGWLIRLLLVWLYGVSWLGDGGLHGDVLWVVSSKCE
jgi:hypothetical protein